MTNHSDPQPVQNEQITARARELWQKAGSPDGRDLEFWLAAEQELNHERTDLEQTQHGDVTPPPRATPGGGQATGTSAAEKTATRKTRRSSKG